MPDWLLDLLDHLPSETAALYFSLFFVAVAWFGVIFVRPIFRLWLRRQHGINDIVSYASAGFSLFYGLLLGLLSVAAYSNAKEISGFVSREAAGLATMYRTAEAYPEPIRGELRYLLRDYTRYVINREWPSYQDGRVPLGGDNRLQAIRATLLSFEPPTATQQIAHGSVLQGFNDMVNLRQQRIGGVDPSIPGVLWYTVGIGAAITIIFILLLDVRFTFHLFISGLITFFLGLMVFIIYVQDRPLRSDVAASAAPFVQAYETVMRWDDGG
ncbi:hypothetical protein ACQW02_15680 [Humitalea sp. 24SJ18S-53]|uniref:bestrophin-like domain n=1 Tax=Humitalea sp. 24SJ18S-53 TaxID=3422307 RepID=UPI003D677939